MKTMISRREALRGLTLGTLLAAVGLPTITSGGFTEKNPMDALLERYKDNPVVCEYIRQGVTGTEIAELWQLYSPYSIPPGLTREEIGVCQKLFHDRKKRIAMHDEFCQSNFYAKAQRHDKKTASELERLAYPPMLPKEFHGPALMTHKKFVLGLEKLQQKTNQNDILFLDCHIRIACIV